MTIITSYFDYEHIREIGVGQGRNSNVFLSRDPQTGGEIAVKEIPKTAFHDPNEFFKEAQSMKAADCPNVVPIKVCSQTVDRVCLVMPYFRNGSLLDRISAGPLSIKESIRVAQGVLAGLGQIHHSARIIHFDVKPSNILFADNNDVMVSDFGQSRFVNASGLSAIPPMYVLAMPPEAISTRHGSYVSDVFQAGLTLYRMVNGNPFFEDQFALYPNPADLQRVILDGKFPNRDLFLEHVPKWLRTVIRKSLRVNPAERYSSARAMSAALNHAVDLDWQANVLSTGEINWTASRPKKARLLVKLCQRSPAWAIEVYSGERNGKPLPKNKAVLWRDGLSAKQASNYLKQLFPSLE